MLNFLDGFVKAIIAIFSFLNRKEEKSAEEEFQRVKNSQDELSRVVNANEKRNEATAIISNDDARDRLLKSDPLNRDNNT